MQWLGNYYLIECLMAKKIPFDVDLLKNWFKSAQRDLPWRKVNDPYAVWVSEIMLQQTQVAVVKEYYLRWMARFPTIASLAEAPLEEAIKMWEGLGYYSRVRNLHEAAQFLIDNYRGKLPDTKVELMQVKGLGPYTIGAILSFAFHQKAAAVDGNTMRVLSRYYGIDEDIQKSSTLKQIWKIAEEILPEDEPWLVVEGLIELGATLCKRDPDCFFCPLRDNCLAYKQGTQRLLPKKGKKVEITFLSRQVFVIACEGALLVRKGETGKAMADLYEFPYLDLPIHRVIQNLASGNVGASDLQQAQSLAKQSMCKHMLDTASCKDEDADAANGKFLNHDVYKKKEFPFPFAAKKLKSLPEVDHAFTRFKVKLFPTLWKTFKKFEMPEYEWVSWQAIHKHPFSSGHKRILSHLELSDF